MQFSILTCFCCCLKRYFCRPWTICFSHGVGLPYTDFRVRTLVLWKMHRTSRQSQWEADPLKRWRTVSFCFRRTVKCKYNVSFKCWPSAWVKSALWTSQQRSCWALRFWVLVFSLQDHHCYWLSSSENRVLGLVLWLNIVSLLPVRCFSSFIMSAETHGKKPAPDRGHCCFPGSYHSSFTLLIIACL